MPSQGADLLVVGSRGHGGLAGMLLGSVSEHVIAHANCPVVVIRHHPATPPLCNTGEAMTLTAASSRPTHTPEDLALIDRYWRAANYLSVGQI